MVVVTGSLFAMPTAQAANEVVDSTAAAPRLVTTRHAPMWLVGFATAQAAKAGSSATTEFGSQVLRQSQGCRDRARTGRPATAQGSVAPDNAVYGNRGSSFFYLYDLTGSAFALRAGFSVTSNAYDFAWDTRTIGQNSFQTDNWEWSDYGPMWPGRSWTSGYKKSTQDTYAGTYYYGRVTYGVAYLTNGGICVSGYPNDGKYLYK